MNVDSTHVVPDGREVQAVYEGQLVGWTVWFAGQELQPVTATDIHDALVDLFDLENADRWPDWFLASVAALAVRETGEGRGYLCPCCNQPTLGEPPPGTYEICKQCGWEDDLVQFKNLDLSGGANSESLREARRNYRVHGRQSAPLSPPPRPRSGSPRTDDSD